MNIYSLEFRLTPKLDQSAYPECLVCKHPNKRWKHFGLDWKHDWISYMHNIGAFNCVHVMGIRGGGGQTLVGVYR